MSNSNCNSCALPPDPLLSTGDCILDENGVPILTPVVTTPATGCTETVSGFNCPTTESCSPWELTLNSDGCVIDDYIQEQLNIAGADLYVHKLLGVHEQGKLHDLTGSGTAISNGSHPNFPASNAFDKFVTEWRSLQTGTDVVKNAYIGYDFGQLKLDNGRLRYGTTTYVKQHITTIKLKQGCDSNSWAKKIRIERSFDGIKWFGVSVMDIPSCSGLITLSIAVSTPSRFWRLRPLEFVGGPSDSWIVQAIQLIDYESTRLSNIQDKILMENRDRDYQEIGIKLKAQYTPQDTTSFNMGFGISTNDKFIFDVSFTDSINRLGRPIVIGDILQVPSETQYTATLKPKLKFLQVTDVSWSAKGFTPQWRPTLISIVAEPLQATQESQAIVGKLTSKTDDLGLVDNYDGTNPIWQDVYPFTATIRADADTMVPQRGTDFGDVAQMTDEMIAAGKRFSPNLDISKLSKSTSIYGIDALPPNGLPYTEGDQFSANPADKAYHRLTYTNAGTNIPARLYRYNAIKQRWQHMHSDLRAEIADQRYVLQEFLSPETSTMTSVKAKSIKT